MSDAGRPGDGDGPGGDSVADAGVSNADPVINETYGNVGLTHTGGVANGLFSAPLVQGGATARSQVSFSLGATKSINYR